MRRTVTWILPITFLFLLSVTACRPSLERPPQQPEEAMLKVSYFPPSFSDDMDFYSLVKAVEKNMEYLYRLDPGTPFQYGSDTYTCAEIRESQEAFLRLMSQHQGTDELDRKVQRQFRVYRAAGRVGNRKVLFTGYFEPIFDARLKPNETYKYPIYRKPDDLLKIDLSRFKEKFAGEHIIARIEDDKVLPYYSRRSIDMQQALKGRGLEIAWLKSPVDVAFLQIQGSGRLRLADGSTITVGYRASNGRPYRSIGRYMIEQDYLSREEMSMQAIRTFLLERPETINKILNYNPSYVFFRILESGPLGNIAVPLTPGRSIALDSDLFPKGALAFISTEKPILDPEGEIKAWKEFSRFVINQDTGGAIQGAGRADIFWGSGAYAETAAGHMKHEGELFFLVRK